MDNAIEGGEGVQNRPAAEKLPWLQNRAPVSVGVTPPAAPAAVPAAASRGPEPETGAFAIVQPRPTEQAKSESEDAGPEIILNVDGKPFPSNDAARAFLRERNLPQNTWAVAEYPGGFAIMTFREIMRQREEYERDLRADLERAKKRKPMKYFRVTLHPSENGPKTVPLVCHGVEEVTLVAGKEAVISECLLEGLRNASKRNLQPVPRELAVKHQEKAFIDLGDMPVHPYSVLGEVSEAEWREFRKSQKAIVETAIKRELPGISSLG